MLRNILTILAILAMNSCATEGKYRASLDNWIGHPIDEYIRAAGLPTRQMQVNGGMAYDYYSSDSAATIRQTYGNSYRIQDQSSYCDTTFFTDSSGTIRHYRYEGNSCISY